MKEVGIDEVVNVRQAVQVITGLKGFSVFSGAQHLLDYLSREGGLIKPQRVTFQSRTELRGGQSMEVPVDFGYIVPFLPNLERNLLCDDIRDCVENPREHNPLLYKTLLDGHFYQSHPIFLKNKTPVAIVGYSDGIEVTDSASPRAGKHHVTLIYWTLANIHPELRSTDKVINLLAVVRTSSLNRVTWNKLLADFHSGLEKLASDEGVSFLIHRVPTVYHGLLLMWCGDTPAQANVGGFKESVSFAEKPCRQCLACRFYYLKITDAAQFELRTKESHEQHVAEVEAYTPPPAASRVRRVMGEESPDPSVRYGVNWRSTLMRAPHFDVTKCLVQDMLHLVPEGLEQLVTKIILVHIVKDKKSMSLADINERIEAIGKVFRRDRPSSRNTDEHLNKKTLRQSAAQMNNLFTLLPFILRKKSEDGHWHFAGDQQYLQLLLQLIKIMNLCMAYELTVGDSEKLEKKVSEFHGDLLKLNPDITMAKVHFLHHLTMQILLFGVLRQQACYRFEAHHAFFKRMLRITRNFINVLFSMALRHQTKQCQRMMQPNFLYEGHKYTVKKDLPVNVFDANVNLLKSIFPEAKKIQEINNLKMYGTLYSASKKRDCIILLSDSEMLPQFGKILEIFCVDNDRFGFVCQVMKTQCLRSELNAYEVSLSGLKTAVDACNLIFPHEITSIKWDGQWHVVVHGHRALLT